MYNVCYSYTFIITYCFPTNLNLKVLKKKSFSLCMIDKACNFENYDIELEKYLNNVFIAYYTQRKRFLLKTLKVKLVRK